MKTFNDYQRFTESLAKYNQDLWLHNVHRESCPNQIVGMPYMYPAMALAEEAGEVVGKIAKFIRKSKQDVDTEKLREDVLKELGDLQYQLSETARMFGYTLQDVVDMNVAKLTDREERGVLIGEGDER